jgi:uncharacterized LabA/DUF88 family protein
MKVWVYVDGFNLYNGALRNTTYKWLDLEKLAYQILLPSATVDCVKYFSAKVKARPNDPTQPIRQMVYWRALRTLPCLEIIEGSFAVRPVSMPTVISVDQIQHDADSGMNVLGRRPAMVQVYKSEEKGTDVNLAAHLVHDANKGRFDTALIFSNDSDLKEAVRIVKVELGLVVGVVNPAPARRRPSELQSSASFYRQLRNADLAASQFPDPIVTPQGNIIKPSAW